MIIAAYLLLSLTSPILAFPFSLFDFFFPPTVPGDYNGDDRKTDMAIYRQGLWEIRES